MPILRTRQDLINWIDTSVYPDPERTTAERADWFVACAQALTLQDGWSTKDLAYLFLDGVPSIKAEPEQEVAAYLATYWEDVDDWRKEGNEENARAEEEAQSQLLEELLCRHFYDNIKPAYMSINDEMVVVDELHWLEDGRDVNGNRCARYSIGNEDSVWLDEDMKEVEVE